MIYTYVHLGKGNSSKLLCSHLWRGKEWKGKLAFLHVNKLLPRCAWIRGFSLIPMDMLQAIDTEIIGLEVFVLIHLASSKYSDI